MLEKLNPTVIGYALNVVGLFFLASAITFKKPRRQIEELLGVERSHSLHGVRDQLVNKIQTIIGFVILVVGFVLLMGDALRSGAPPPEVAPVDSAAEPSIFWLVAILLGITLATTGALKIVELGYVRTKFRRLLREVVLDSKFNLDKNLNLAVQIGELLSIPKDPDHSIGDYIARVKAELGISRPVPSAPGPPLRPARTNAK
jgi:hypothetical protein